MGRNPVAACWLLAVLTFAAAPTEAQQCSPTDFANRCSPEQHQRMLELYGLTTIDVHHDAGDQVRRVFYVDGYDHDVVAISYVRSPGREPVVSVHLPRREDGRVPEPLVASVPEDVWNRVRDRSRFFDRALEPARQSDSYETVCIHPWVWTVEATDQPDAAQDRPTRRRTDDGCSFGLAGEFALELEAITVPFFTFCRALDTRYYRTEANLLADCFRLRGDRNAAAMVRNRVHELTRVSSLSPALGPGRLFAPGAEIHLAGERIATSSAGHAWMDRVWGDAASLSVDAVSGESSARVVVTGQLTRIWSRAPPASREGGRDEVAEIEMIWTRDGDGFYLERARIGEFKEEVR